MMIKIDPSLTVYATQGPESHTSDSRKLGEDFSAAMPKLEQLDLGGGWSVEPGNTECGTYRLALLKDGIQAAVFDENMDGIGNPILPKTHIHPFIEPSVAMERLQAAVTLGLQLASDPFNTPAPETSCAPAPSA